MESSSFMLIKPGMRLLPRHCVAIADNSISAMLSQLPCLGVKCISSRCARRKASSGENVSYNDEIVCVFKLSITNTTFSASGYCSSSSHLILPAQSFFVLCGNPRAYRQPASGSVKIKILQVPSLMYSKSSRSGFPGFIGIDKLIRFLVHAYYRSLFIIRASVHR